MMLKNIDASRVLIGMTTCPRLWCTWFAGFENSVLQWMPEGTSERRARAVMKILDKQGYVTGCHCGCRGDYQLTESGEKTVDIITHMHDGV